MVSDRHLVLRRRYIVGWSVLIVSLLAFLSALVGADDMSAFFLLLIWPLMVAWVGLDAAYRCRGYVLWSLLTLFTGPVGLFFYLITRPAVPEICVKCGNPLSNQQDTCPYCGNQGALRKAKLKLQWVWQELLRAVAGGPVDKAKETVKYLTIGSATATVFFWFLSFATQGRVILFPIMLLLSTASYWVLVAWWVYLDATWRRMEAVPWGLLTLVTNIFGLVTYLVIRYPEPRTCPQCSASLPTHLKRCPYCGSEVEPGCPRCQSPVQPDWLFCPACSAQIPRPQPHSAPVPGGEGSHTPPVSPVACLRGTVVDAVTGAPVAGALVRVDSRSEAHSATTNEQGRYELPDMPLQPYVLLASAEGYAEDAQVFEPSAGVLQRVHFALQPLVVESSGVSS